MVWLRATVTDETQWMRITTWIDTPPAPAAVEAVAPSTAAERDRLEAQAFAAFEAAQGG